MYLYYVSSRVIEHYYADIKTIDYTLLHLNLSCTIYLIQLSIHKSQFTKWSNELLSVDMNLCGWEMKNKRINENSVENLISKIRYSFSLYKYSTHLYCITFYFISTRPWYHRMDEFIYIKTSQCQPWTKPIIDKIKGLIITKWKIKSKIMIYELDYF